MGKICGVYVYGVGNSVRRRRGLLRRPALIYPNDNETCHRSLSKESTESRQKGRNTATRWLRCGDGQD